MDDGKFHKVANVIGESMKLHPHGDASIANALVVLANKEYFIEKQGNFGNVVTGHSAAALDTLSAGLRHWLARQFSTRRLRLGKTVTMAGVKSPSFYRRSFQSF